MAFGFPASSSTTVTTTGSPDQVRNAIVGALTALKWKYQIVSPDRCEAQVAVNLMSWGEVMTIELTGPNVMSVKSACRGIQVFDWGKNKQNIDEFLAAFSMQHQRALQAGQHQQFQNQSGGPSPVENLFRDDES